MGILQDEIEGDIGAAPHCATCGAQRVVRDAWACWNPGSGLWEIETVFDQGFCQACGTETGFVWKRVAEPPRQAIRELNDRFRTTGAGNGSVVATSGVAAQGEAFVRAALAAVRGFDAFTPENDPWGGHDFGAVEIAGERLFWKIDCTDPMLRQGSENPGNEAVTHRILTIMLASE